MLAEVDTICPYGEGNINLVVDQQTGAVPMGQGAEFSRQWQELRSRKIFLPELDSFDTAT